MTFNEFIALIDEGDCFVDNRIKNDFAKENCATKSPSPGLIFLQVLLLAISMEDKKDP